MSNLALIGYRGSGKTTVARLLARQLGWASIDADREIESSAGSTIAALFAERGEEYFRDLETEVVGRLCRLPRTVVALGGGAVIRPENRRAIAEATHVVWLKAPPEVLARRIAADPSTPRSRPALTPQGGAEEIDRLLELRTPWYRACATLEVDTLHKSPEQIVAEVLAALPLTS